MTDKAPKTPKYKTAEGDYLVIEQEGDYHKIYWYIKENDDIGGALGENTWSKGMPSKKSDWECWQADTAVKDMADGRDPISGYWFETYDKAKAALAEANRCLLTGEAPWPAWAVQAREAGWTPPEGWKP